MKSLVIGGAGFIGFHLARFLHKKGHVVHIGDNFQRAEQDEEFNKLIKDGVTHIPLDITNASSFSQLDTNYDQVYHLAAINGTGNFYKIPDQVVKVGALGTINVLDWFSGLKKSKLVFSSSSEAYAGFARLAGSKFPLPTPEHVPLVVDDPSNVRWCYGASKLLGEVAMHSYAKAKGISMNIVRYHNIYGPRMGYEHVIPQFIKRIADKEDPFSIIGTGEETRTFCYVDDAVAATQLVMEQGKNNETYHIGRSDEEVSIKELAQKLFSLAKVTPTITYVQGHEGSVARRCPDITKLSRLGYQPNVTIDEGLQKIYQWYTK